jgi:hypothetical protein
MSDATAPIGGRVSLCDYASVPVAASTTIYKGTLICANAAGDAVDAEDLQEFNLLGVARDSVNNSAGSAGDLDAEYWTSGQFDFTIAATADNTYLGLPVYVSDNQTVTLTPTAYLGAVGIVRKVNSTTSVRVELMPGMMADPGGRVEQTLKLPLVAATDTTAGGVLTVRNTSGVARIITNFFVNVSTQSSGAATIDAGVATTVATNDTLIDGASVAAVALLDFTENQGTNGADARLWADDSYVTITASADTTGLVGSAYITYINA